ncbi:MAG: hypothetical protein ACFB2Y_16980 [Fulvivirga sp.]
MALIRLEYCRAENDTNYVIRYDDIAHEIYDGLPFGSCVSKGRPTPRLLYRHIDGDTEYTVFTQSVFPYAYVSATFFGCDAVINSVLVANATDEDTADGTASIDGDGNGTQEYSIDGVNYQTSNLFVGLSSGEYTAYLRNTTAGGQQCVATSSFVILAETVRCELRLGNIRSTVNTITIVTIENAVQAVEYAAFLTSGGMEVWQDDPVFLLGTSPPAGEYTVKVRYKDQVSCVDTRQIILGSADCDLFIENVTVINETGVFAKDGYINIIATSNQGPIEYQLNDGAFQSASSFSGLAPGSYDVTVRDAGSCLDTRRITVFAYRPPFIHIPLVNPHRFVVDNNDLPTEYNRLFKDIKLPGVIPCEWYQPINRNMVLPIQFQSNYGLNELKVYDNDDTLVDTISTVKKTDNTDFNATLNDVYFASLGDTGQLYFNDGLPEFAQVNQTITLSGFSADVDGDYTIIDLLPGTGPAEGFEVMIIELETLVTAGTVLQGSLIAIYDLEIYDTYEVVINWGNYNNGFYYLELTGSDERYGDYRAPSEPIYLATSHPNVQVLRWKNIENKFQISYDTGIEFSMLLPCFFGRPTPGGERTVAEDSRRNAIKLEEYVTDNPELVLDNIPPYFAMQLSKILAHDQVYFNDVAYVKTEELEIEYFPGDPLCNAETRLRRTETDAYNSDDTAQDVDVPQTILGLNNYLLEVTP